MAMSVISQYYKLSLLRFTAKNIEIPEAFESSRMEQASMKKLVADDGYLSFRYEGTYGSFSENTWNGP